MSAQDRKMAQREAEFLKPLNDQHIIRYQDAFTNKNNFYIVLEFANAGDLSHLINKQRKMNTKWSDFIVKDCVRQIVAGLNYLHSYKEGDAHGILHRDLKPQNILACKSSQSAAIVTFKIADFGLAREMEHTLVSVNTKGWGTKVYMSPETLHKNQKYSFPSDIWALGCILFELW